MPLAFNSFFPILHTLGNLEYLGMVLCFTFYRSPAAVYPIPIELAFAYLLISVGQLSHASRYRIDRNCLQHTCL